MTGRGERRIGYPVLRTLAGIGQGITIATTAPWPPPPPIPIVTATGAHLRAATPGKTMTDHHDIHEKPVLHHVTLKTVRVAEMVDWYGTVVGCVPNFQFEAGAWTTNDEANHRVAFLQTPALSDDADKLSHAGMHHMAFEFSSLASLLKNYVRLAAIGILPHACLDHGLTTSFFTSTRTATASSSGATISATGSSPPNGCAPRPTSRATRSASRATRPSWPQRWPRVCRSKSCTSVHERVNTSPRRRTIFGCRTDRRAWRTGAAAMVASPIRAGEISWQAVRTPTACSWCARKKSALRHSGRPVVWSRAPDRTTPDDKWNRSLGGRHQTAGPLF